MNKRTIVIILTALTFFALLAFPLLSCGGEVESPDTDLPTASEGLQIGTFFGEDGSTHLSVTGIGECKDSKIVIPSEYNGMPIEEVATRAFYGAEGITEITVPCSVKKISLFAFAGCKDLETVTLCNGVDFIDESAFADCGKLNSVTLPSSVKYVGSYAFIRTALTDISFPDGVEYVGREVMAKTPYFSASENWENGLLYADKVLLASEPDALDERCAVKEGTRVIASAVFADVAEGPAEIVIPHTVEKIGDSVFSNCPSLIKVTLSDSLTELGFGAFSNCSALETVNLPKNLTSISTFAFSDCARLTSVNIPVGVTYIGSDAFPSGITDIYYGGTKDEWERIDSDWSSDTVTVHCTDPTAE